MASNASHPAFELIEKDDADAGRGTKFVFRGVRDDGRVATFETGSFFDNGGKGGAPYKHDICVSTAGGCTRKCRFCSVPDAALGFERLLTAGEIVGQVDLVVAHRNPDGAFVNNVGLMGNGEPPDNPQTEVAIRALMNRPYKVNRIIVSTIGENLRAIRRYSDLFSADRGLAVPVILHFSLHVADDEKRRLIIPGKETIATIMRVADEWSAAAYDPLVNPHPLRLNVVLFEGAGFTNSTPKDADALADVVLAPSSVPTAPRRLLKIAAYNPIPGKPYRAPSLRRRELFVARLRDRGVADLYTFRGSGIDIDMVTGHGGFACGQLRATTHLAASLPPHRGT